MSKCFLFNLNSANRAVNILCKNANSVIYWKIVIIPDFYAFIILILDVRCDLCSLQIIVWTADWKEKDSSRSSSHCAFAFLIFIPLISFFMGIQMPKGILCSVSMPCVFLKTSQKHFPVHLLISYVDLTKRAWEQSAQCHYFFSPSPFLAMEHRAVKKDLIRSRHNKLREIFRPIQPSPGAFLWTRGSEGVAAGKWW